MPEPPPGRCTLAAFPPPKNSRPVRLRPVLVSVPVSWLLTDDFPHRLSDDELAEAVNGIAGSISARYGNSPASWLPELQIALLQAALQEQSRRLADDANRSSRRATRLTLAVAVAASLLALIFGVLDYFGDQSWQDDQIRILTEIRDRLSSG